MTHVNTNRLQYFNVSVASGNGYLYLYAVDTNDLLTITGDVRFRLVQALDTYKTTYPSYTGILEEDGEFIFSQKGLVFTGLSGASANPNGSGNGSTISTNSQA